MNERLSLRRAARSRPGNTAPHFVNRRVAAYRATRARAAVARARMRATTAVSLKPHLFALDGDDAVLRKIAEIAAPHFQALTTRDPRKLLAWLEYYRRVDAIVTEHVLQTSHGVALLESARTMRPEARRVLLTTYHDLPSIVAGLHSGAIQHLVQKPFTPTELLSAVLPEGALNSQPNQHRASA